MSLVFRASLKGAANKATDPCSAFATLGITTRRSPVTLCDYRGLAPLLKCDLMGITVNVYCGKEVAANSSYMSKEEGLSNICCLN